MCPPPSMIACMGRRAHGKASMDDIEVLIDSDAFIGLLLEQAAHHAQVVRIFDTLKARTIPLATTSFVVAETATVLRQCQWPDVGAHIAR
jgi:predicted nucleic acid-binding protein